MEHAKDSGRLAGLQGKSEGHNAAAALARRVEETILPSESTFSSRQLRLWLRARVIRGISTLTEDWMEKGEREREKERENGRINPTYPFFS